MPGLLPHIDPDGLLEFSVVYTDRATQAVVAGAARLSPHHALKDNSAEHHWGGLMTASSIYVNLGTLLPNWE